jgi:pilus assembly protein CpaB
MLMLAAFALVVSGVVTWLAYSFLSPRFAPADDTVEVVVTTGRIGLGTMLEPSHLRVIEWPRASEMEGTFSRIEDVAGRGLIATVFANEPILDTKLAPAGVGAGLSTAIPEGMRAVAVKVNDVIGVAGFALPGTRVDVVLSGSPEEGNDTDTAKIFLENVQVLASGQNVEQDGNGQPQQVQVITLLVTPEDAQRLALASVDGQIQLALRNPLDVEPSDPEAVVRRSLYERRTPADEAPAPARAPAPRRAAVVAPPAPPPPPPPAPPEPEPFTVDVFMGTDKTSVTYQIVRENP